MTTYGIGEFRMRNGGKAVVLRTIGSLLHGVVDGEDHVWNLDGTWPGLPEFDLIGPWEEPAPADPAEEEIATLKAELAAAKANEANAHEMLDKLSEDMQSICAEHGAMAGAVRIDFIRTKMREHAQELAAANAEIERLKNELGDPRGEIDHAKSISQIARNEALDEAVAAIYSRLKERHNTSSPDFDNGCIGGFQYSIWAIEALKEQS